MTTGGTRKGVVTETYICENCRETFAKDRTDEEARAVVCDDCYKAFMVWFEAFPESEKQEMEKHKNEMIR